MKKSLVLAMLALILAGCGKEPVPVQTGEVDTVIEEATEAGVLVPMARVGEVDVVNTGKRNCQID